MKKCYLSFVLALILYMSVAVPAFAVEPLSEVSIKWISWEPTGETDHYNRDLNWIEVHTDDGGTAVVDLETGKKVNEYDIVYASSEGLAMVEKNSQYGYINSAGVVVVPLEYDSVTDFSDGIARVGKKDSDGKVKWGCIDRTGAAVVPPEYDWINEFSDGLASVQQGTKWGYIDRTGAVVVPIEYDSATNFSDGIATVGKRDDDGKVRYSCINRTGTVVTSLVGEYDYVGGLFNGLARVGKIDTDGNMKYGCIDKTGAIVIPLEYDDTNSSDGLVRVGKKDANGKIKYGYIDKTGVVVVPPEYDSAYYYSSVGLVRVEKQDSSGNWKYGCIDKAGAVITPLGKYDSIGVFFDGLASVEKNGKCGFIDKTGALVVPLEYDNVLGFSDGLARVGKKDSDGNMRYSFIDKTGTVVPPLVAEYDYVDSFSDGLAQVRKRDSIGNLMYGYINKTGMVVVPLDLYNRYHSVSTVTSANSAYVLSKTEYWVVKDGKYGFFVSPYTANNGARVSDWAKSQVDEALISNLAPIGLGNDYRVNITRAQFAAITVKLYEAMSGQITPIVANSPFTDIDDFAVVQAEALGFVAGMGGNKFEPDSLVTREQAAAMLSRVYTKLGGKIPVVKATTFVDNESVSSWARDSVAFMADNGIISGIGDNKFAPQGNATIEQALSIAFKNAWEFEVIVRWTRQ